LERVRRGFNLITKLIGLLNFWTWENGLLGGLFNYFGLPWSSHSLWKYKGIPRPKGWVPRAKVLDFKQRVKRAWVNLLGVGLKGDFYFHFRSRN